ncbi:methyltransferase [Micromonospora sp. NBC_01739]|uniref:methyltransferase n=1 Tax=Micromonospora sp. NBC_01739 TaxID=2975985 RepID=UPI002E1686D3|nr:methyltransferase [Micromonospora sp. NBC_01739]
MTTSQAPAPPATAADRERIAQLVCGHMATRTISAAAALGVADIIGPDGSDSAQVAAAAGTDPGATLRLLRALAALEVLRETEPGRFALTGIGELLRTDRPDSMAEFVAMTTDPAMLGGWAHLDQAIRTGGEVFSTTFGTSFFGHLAGDPQLSARFNAAMRQGTRLAAQVLPQAYDFGRFRTVADVGGGDGTLLAAVLAAHPEVQGLLYDTAEGLAQADTTLAGAGVAERCTLATGDFFASVPAGAEAYLLKSILHDWDDERAAVILRHVRAVIPPHGRLLIVDAVLPDLVDAQRSPLGHLGDLNMLVQLSGRERTRSDFAALCQATGFRLTSVTGLAPARFSLVEAVPTGC